MCDIEDMVVCEDAAARPIIAVCCWVGVILSDDSDADIVAWALVVIEQSSSCGSGGGEEHGVIASSSSLNEVFRASERWLW